MKSKFVSKLLVVLLILSFPIIDLSYAEDNSETRSLFSWKSSEVIEGRGEMFQTMQEMNLNTVYQHFSSRLKQEDIEAYLLEAESKNIEVSFMDGSSKWALEKNAEHAIKSLERVIKINKNLHKSKGIKSIIFDIEPYTLKEWNTSTREEIMEKFVAGMKLTYNKAKANNIEVILCIPYYYDTVGLSVQLEELIEKGCDSVAIMNYYKKREAKHIEQEVEFAYKHGKKVINIYELKAPGTHGLVEKNTYYNDGILAVEKSFINIKRELPGKDISIAFHDYRAVKEVLNRDRIAK